MSRQFSFEPATRKAVPLLVGLMGPSGGGKTFSALRLARGIQRVFPGPIIGIDTESGRMLHYADEFDFRHTPFGAPFGSLDYLEVLNQAASHKPSVILVDSMSHEHSGIGGMIDAQEKELDRMAGDDYAKRQRCQMLAWKKPKADRRKLIDGLLQMNSNFIFCFRAKESSRPVKNKQTGKSEVENFGFMPIAGDEFVFEMTINMLLLPHANGYPSWQSDNKGENMMMKLPQQFRGIFENKSIQLTEDIGEKLALWAKGDQKPKKPATKKTAPKNSTPARCLELEKLEHFLATNQVEDRQITIKDKTANLLEKTKGAVKHIKKEIKEKGSFTAENTGFSSTLKLIEIIEEDIRVKEQAEELQGNNHDVQPGASSAAGSGEYKPEPGDLF